jgi:hypothetical protein
MPTKLHLHAKNVLSAYSGLLDHLFRKLLTTNSDCLVLIRVSCSAGDQCHHWATSGISRQSAIGKSISIFWMGFQAPAPYRRTGRGVATCLSTDVPTRQTDLRLAAAQVGEGLRKGLAHMPLQAYPPPNVNSMIGAGHATAQYVVKAGAKQIWLSTMLGEELL